MPSAFKHVILDRDGVLNVESPDGGYVRKWSQWTWMPGALEGLAMLGSAGICVSIATNQSGVGRGLVRQADLEVIHARMGEEAARCGCFIDGVFVCPHAPDLGCTCRKPAPGLLLRAVEASAVSRAATIMLGDDLRDIEAAWAAGVSPALVRTGKGRNTQTLLHERGVPVFDDLRAFAAVVLSDSLTPAGAAP